MQDFLRFLSNDKYVFEFCQLEKERPVQEYIELGDQQDWPFYGVDRVLMFSGGLDSLAGAAETAAQGKKLVLVSHRPVSTIYKRQRDLFQKLREIYRVPMIHVPVWINKSARYGKEHTQRTRSFLYSAVGTVVAESMKASGVRFFENGVVSLNLPVADEVLRARASRTTHPVVLEQFSRFYSLITERPFVVDNPYLFNTKTDVVSGVEKHGGAKLIGLTCSCSHSYFQSQSQWHCGTCGQCIDPRIAVLASGLEHHDPAGDYVVDVFTGPRKEGQEKNIAIDYVRHGFELNRMGEAEITERFNLEIMRAVRFTPRRSEAAQQLVEMHKRHGQVVYKVLTDQIQEHASQLLDGKLDPGSMLALVAGQVHLEPVWKRYAETIMDVLDAGIPPACQTHKPTNEPHLQEICDGILKGHEPRLVREFPFLRWSSSLTKPDLSFGLRDLWIEIKYVRKKQDLRPITESLAADITKYNDNVKFVLFVVYDPYHLVVDDGEFSEPIRSRQNMVLHFIR